MRSTLFLLVALFFVTLVAAKGHGGGSSSGGSSSGGGESSSGGSSSNEGSSGSTGSTGSTSHSSSSSNPGGAPNNSTSAGIERYQLTPLFLTGAVVSTVYAVMN